MKVAYFSTVAAALTLTSASYAQPSTAGVATFPAEMRASWADVLSSCEPEFTGGFKIGRNEVSFYDGPAKLMSISAVAAVKTPSGPGKSVTARIRGSEGGESYVQTDRFTLVGKWLYHSDAKDSLVKHLSHKNRMVRCPPGSTG